MTMKASLLVALITASLFSCQGASDDERKEELKSVLHDFYTAMAKKDIQKMNELTTTDFVFWDEGKVYNNQSAVASVEPIGAFTATFRLDSLHSHIDKTNASAYCYREADFIIGGTASPSMKYFESATFRKEGGKWKLRFLHSSERK